MKAWRAAVFVLAIVAIVTASLGLWKAHTQESHVKQHNNCAFNALETGGNPDACKP